MSKKKSKAIARGQWASRFGFVLAASGSAIGLGNIWKFPYITGENGGGSFVLIYLLCILVVGFPVMIAEILIGRTTQKSPVSAFTQLTSENSLWSFVGKLGVLTGFIILSYYSVVAGWAMNYSLMSINHFFDGKSPREITSLFGILYNSAAINTFWHFLFMGLTVGIVYNGVKGGIERWAGILMPLLFGMLLILLVCGIFLDPASFGKALKFTFVPTTKLKPSGVLEALGHAFFTLSIGMGVMLTYGSYLAKEEDIPKASLWICGFDTLIALIACLVIFPILFTFDTKLAGGPGLVFKTMPVMFSQIQGGLLIAILFFTLLTFAALTSAISILEVLVSYLIDDLKWTRKKATLIAGGATFLFGIPSTAGWLLSDWKLLYGKDFFVTMDDTASNWLLALGGLLVAIFVGWIMDGKIRKEEFQRGSSLKCLYPVWLWTLRVIVPTLIFIVLLNKIGMLPTEYINELFGVHGK